MGWVGKRSYDCSFDIIIAHMSTLSLLVDCHRIIGWLEDRKKLRKDWFNYLKAAEEKVKALLKDREWASSHPKVHDYLHQHEQYFNYNDVSAVVDLMLESGMGEKNLLFGYSNPQMKEWAALQKYMQKNSINLLSLAKFIEQALKFDLPALDKAVEGLDGQLTTLKRKIDFNRNTIFSQTNVLKKEKQTLGIDEAEQHLPIETLIERLVRAGPKQLERFEQECQSEKVKEYLKQYNATNEVNGISNPLQKLIVFVQRGDQFVSAPVDTEKYRDFKNWRPTNQWQIVIEGQASENKQQADPSTVLQSPEFRQDLLYDLSQLLYFFKGVRHELASASKGLGFEAENMKSMSMVEGQVDEAVTTIDQLITLLTSKQLTAPLDLKNSKKAYQLMVSHFKGFQANIATMNEQISAYQSQIESVQQKREQQAEKLLWLRRKVVGARPKCQEWLGQLVKKEVKITGEINKFD